MRMQTIRGIDVPNFEPTVEGWALWEQMYKTGDGLFFHYYDPFNLIAMAIQIRGMKFPELERYTHVEPIENGEDGYTIKADGTEVRGNCVDTYRQDVFDHKLRLVIYRATPDKTPDATKKFQTFLHNMLYTKYDRKKLWGMVVTNFTNFWNWICRKPDVQNTIGDPKLPVCCDTLYGADIACGMGYSIMPGVDVENIDPSNLGQDTTYTPIASIG